MRQLRRGVELLRNEGPVTFLRRSTAYLNERVSTEYENLEVWYQEARGGTLSLTIGEHTAVFDAAPSAGGDWIRSMYDSEAALTRELLDTLEPDDIVYEIGANIGFHTCFVATALTEGTVVAIEPYPPNVRQLKANIQHNGGDAIVIEAAASNRDGSVGLTAPPDGSAGHQISSIASTPRDDTYTTRSMTIDSLVTNGKYPAPNVIKIDVEGAEQQVIEGMQSTLNRADCRLVFCELHHPNELVDRPSVQEFGGHPDEIREILVDCGFSITTTEERKKTTHIKATKITE